MDKVVFDCNGKIKINDWRLSPNSLFLQKEIDKTLNEKMSNSNLNYNFFDCQMSDNNNLKYFARSIELLLKKLERHEKPTSFGYLTVNEEMINYFSTRQTICQFILCLRDYMHSIKQDKIALKEVLDESDFDDLLLMMQRFLNRLQYLPDQTFFYAASNVGNKSDHPEYHMYHLHLDLRWFIITLLYTKSASWKNTENSLADLESILYSTINDLIFIAIKIFVSSQMSELRYKTPYLCTCIRELWLMLQIFIDQLQARGKCKNFWIYVNSNIDQFFPNEGSAETGLFQNLKRFTDCKKPELFCIWLMYHLTLLYSYNDSGEYHNSPSSRMKESQIEINIQQCEKILKIYVNKGGRDGARDEIDEELCAMISFIHTLSFEWWKPHAHIVASLWDCFHRRLDNPFLMQSRGPWSMSSEKKTPMDILEQSRNRVRNTNEVNNESSYGLFLRYLGTFLIKTFNNKDLRIWNQIKSRIYSRFSQNKIQDFSECGLYNFISLFITMAITADTKNVCSTLLNLLPSDLVLSDSAGAKKCCLTWKCKLIVLILYNEQKMNFKDIAKGYTDIANQISCRSDEFSRSMMTWYIDVLRIILTASQDFSQNEHEFLEGWIDRYLQDTAPNRVGVLTSTILQVFEKCNNLQNSTGLECKEMLNSMWHHVASRVRQMAAISDVTTDFYVNSAKLAAAFTIEACRDPSTAKKYKHNPVGLFKYFTTSPIIKDVRIIKLYLSLILRNELATESLKNEMDNFNRVCLQAWVKCSILNTEFNNETIFLKNHMVNLPEMKRFFTEHSKAELLSSDTTIITFFIIIGRKRNSLLPEQLNDFDTLCKLFFQNIDKWSLQSISEETKDNPLSIWIYKCIGTIILCCSPILYVKNQPNNLLKMLINKISLPSEKSNQLYLLHLTQRIFPNIILGIGNLEIESDISLQTLLRDLFDRYFPLLIRKESNNDPIYNVAESVLSLFKKAKSRYSHSLLKILSCNFIIIPKDNTTHKHCHLVMIVLKKLIRGGKSYSKEIFQSIINVCAPSVINCYMRIQFDHIHKQQTIDFIRDITTNSYFQDDMNLRQKFNEISWEIINSSIQRTSSKVCFDFLQSLLKTNVELFQYLYPQVENVVMDCERRRVQKAASLRYSFNGLKRSFELAQSKA